MDTSDSSVYVNEVLRDHLIGLSHSKMDRLQKRQLDLPAERAREDAKIEQEIQECKHKKQLLYTGNHPMLKNSSRDAAEETIRRIKDANNRMVNGNYDIEHGTVNRTYEKMYGIVDFKLRVPCIATAIAFATKHKLTNGILDVDHPSYYMRDSINLAFFPGESKYIE